MMNYVVQVGAIYIVANQMCALTLLFEFDSYVGGLESIHLRFLSCGYNECCRYVELSSFELIGGNTQLDFE
jgi:hypothetical protein